jgi:5-methylthioadenosine/S-adenosylhomocysteine deaminase
MFDFRQRRASRAEDPSRRTLLKSGAGLVAVGAGAIQALPHRALAQGADTELARLQQQRRILIRDGIVLTLDRTVGDFARADVLIEDGKIREVRPDIAAADVAVIDATGAIVIPGFVDTHSHSYEGLLRASLPNGTIFDPTYERDFANLTRAYQPADVYAGVLVTALGMIAMGTTAVVDTSQISHTPEHSDALITAFRDVGIRAVCAYSPGAGNGAKYPQDVTRLRRTYFSPSDQLLTLALGVSRDPKLFAFARETGLRTVMHIRLESEALIALGRAGLLRAGDAYIHCAHLSDEAWRVIRDTGGRTSHSPPLEMAMGHGMPSIQDALDHGLRPSLSSDHTKTVAQDMFGMMRSVFELQRLALLQKKMAGAQNLPPLVTPRDVLEFATIEGARCAAIDRQAGTLTPGKDADIVILRADTLDLWPHSNAFGTVASLMNPSHVETVFIAGKVKKWRGSLTGVDVARVRQLVEAAREAVMRRANFRIEMLG